MGLEEINRPFFRPSMGVTSQQLTCNSKGLHDEITINLSLATSITNNYDVTIVSRSVITEGALQELQLLPLSLSHMLILAIVMSIK